MPYDPLIHNRHAVRLPGFDYSQPATYFITICTHNKKCLFGEIKNNDIFLNKAGALIARTWDSINRQFPEVILDSYIVMPNHLHAILAINSLDKPDKGHQPSGFPYVNPFSNADAQKTGNIDLASVIRYFKSTTTRLYAKEVHDGRLPKFDGKLWQRSYHDRIIRNEEEHDHYRNYIETNPARWNA